MADDPVLDAIDALVEVLRDNAARIDLAIDRTLQMRAERAAGRSYREIEEGARGALFVELTRDNLLALREAGARMRRAEAKALRAEGMTMEEIADLFGVTRQRVSALLKER